jgi:hypothetical protein
MSIIHHIPYPDNKHELPITPEDISSNGLDIQSLWDKLNYISNLLSNDTVFVYKIFSDHYAVMMNFINANTVYVKSMTLEMFEKIVGTDIRDVQLGDFHVSCYVHEHTFYIPSHAFKE